MKILMLLLLSINAFAHDLENLNYNQIAELAKKAEIAQEIKEIDKVINGLDSGWFDVAISDTGHICGEVKEGLIPPICHYNLKIKVLGKDLLTAIQAHRKRIIRRLK
jgi:hypothetical protein